MAETPKIGNRFVSIDIIRGAVMVLMAIDHVRVFAGVPAGGPSFGIFFTRWITHFCAPAFVFLAGTSAFLYARRHDDLRRFLLTRGIWLIFLELTFLRVAWTFNLDFVGYEMAGVIWAIGWSMVLLSAFVSLSPKIVGTIGLVIMFGHNLLDGFIWDYLPSLSNDAGSALLKIVYLGFFGGPISFGPDGPNLIVLYAIGPWFGVMATGYGFGTILLRDQKERDATLLRIGLGAIVLFLILRGFNLYGDPLPWGTDQGLPGIFSFLNATKYPASLLFLLMTLGPSIALMPLLERTRGSWTRALVLFGRVPFFYYVLHIPLIHFLAVVVSFLVMGEADQWLFENHPMGNPPPPDGYAWGLGTLYLVWAVSVGLLYVACSWYADLKARRNDWWLKYL